MLTMTANWALTVRAWEVFTTVPPGVEAFPVSAPVKVSVDVAPPAPVIVVSEQVKVGEATVQANVSDGVVSELPVSV
jgi:hypothetical protein